MKRIIKKLLIAYLQAKRPDFEHVQVNDELIEKALSQLNRLKVETQRVHNAADEMWRSTQALALTELTEENALQRFLRLPQVQMTMYEYYAPFLIPEYFATRSQLRSYAFEPATVLRETSVGAPIPFLFDRRTSGNLFHHIYHVLQFIGHTGVMPDQLNQVIEFGGGYGNMCRVLHRLRFKGRYDILDLPTFNILQEFFLQAHGLISNGDSKINLHVSSDGLQVGPECLYLATWSLSETGEDVRGDQIKLMNKCSHFLIAYRDEFEGMDNARFFKEYAICRQDLEWKLVPCKYINRSYYLFGTKRR